MKKEILLLLAFSLLTVSPIFSQPVVDILSGPVTVSTTRTGKTVLVFTNNQWDKIVLGTKYSSNRLSLVSFKRVVIEIADRQFGQCNKGIGFGCSIFDDLFLKNDHPVLVNHVNRFASAMIKRKNEDMVLLIFIDTIDWNSLQINQ